MRKETSPVNSSCQSPTLILSMRDVESHVSRSYINEFENCICSWEADLISIPHFSKTLTTKAAINFARQAFKLSGNPQIFNPVTNYFSLGKTYDLFFLYVKSL